jgi:hypothetical protein
LRYRAVKSCPLNSHGRQRRKRERVAGSIVCGYGAAPQPGALRARDASQFYWALGYSPAVVEQCARQVVTIRNTVALSYRSGIVIGTGPDVAAPGWAVQFEMEQLVRAGLAPLDALIAATGGAARILGVTDIGTVQPGSRADLVILDGDPLEDITNIRRIQAAAPATREQSRSLRLDLMRPNSMSDNDQISGSLSACVMFPRGSGNQRAVLVHARYERTRRRGGRAAPRPINFRPADQVMTSVRFTRRASGSRRGRGRPDPGRRG